ncbi:GNAT family N-acetyltransferase [Pararhizobium mangrovi]|uniref:N-acetyltransferase n=1 Tax=Pararhizobium mangrovi TaxID=2590452 RepID=A0A506UHS0_9HYPH|nr:N-acetyltransferase [Pararhizobium mangrovi]TPW32864.1 N-acetyltransferase [Pararhizobium mangrovi]
MPISDFVFLSEDPSHETVIQTINEEAFGPGRFTRAAERIREQGPHDRRLSFVCANGGAIVGSVRMTPVLAGGVCGHLLGPLAVRPTHKKLGIGRELVRIARSAAAKAGSEAVLLVGDPPYYRPLGFEPVLPAGALAFPGPVDPHRVLVAANASDVAGRLVGMVRHACPS